MSLHVIIMMLVQASVMSAQIFAPGLSCLASIISSRQHIGTRLHTTRNEFRTAALDQEYTQRLTMTDAASEHQPVAFRSAVDSTCIAAIISRALSNAVATICFSSLDCSKFLGVIF
jgi:hypothetical protein